MAHGDWRCRSEVQLYATTQAREKFGDSALVEMLIHGIPYATCNAAPPVYARHRWVGMDQSIDSLGRLAIIHDILPEAYRRYCDSFGTHKLPERVDLGKRRLGLVADEVESTIDQLAIYDVIPPHTIQTVRIRRWLTQGLHRC